MLSMRSETSFLFLRRILLRAKICNLSHAHRSLSPSSQHAMTSGVRGCERGISSCSSSQRPMQQVVALTTTSRELPQDGLILADFTTSSSSSSESGNRRLNEEQASVDHGGNQHESLYSTATSLFTSPKPVVMFHLKTYGCQMNVSDSDIVRALLLKSGMGETDVEEEADLLLTNTCAIREGAEVKVWNRLKELRSKFRKSKRCRKLVGVLGCMAERLKEDLLQDNLADLVVGPDAYRDLPNLVSSLLTDDQVEHAVNVQLSLDETYADITPIRRNANEISAFVSIQRGCANRCSFCIVPFVRGQERSRQLESIVQEAKQLHFAENVKEIVLLGQNVNSYHDKSEAALVASPVSAYILSNDGFKSRIRRSEAGYYFSDLVAAVSDISPELRVRFTSPHPKDYPPDLLQLMAERHNVCNHVHMPAQSGSTSCLKRMKRGYSREAYLELIDTVHSVIPDIAISSDFIAGFCDETEEEHRDTVALMEQVRYDQAFMFAYSMREKTHAHRTMQDNVPEETKQRRLREIIDVFHHHVHEKNQEREVGRLRLVLVEGESKRSKTTWHGRTDQNKRILFPVEDDGENSCRTDELVRPLLSHIRSGNSVDLFKEHMYDAARVTLQPGDYAAVHVTEAKGHTLRGYVLWRTSMASFTEMKLNTSDLHDDAALLTQLLSNQEHEQNKAAA